MEEGRSVVLDWVVQGALTKKSVSCALSHNKEPAIQRFRGTDSRQGEW